MEQINPALSAELQKLLENIPTRKTNPSYTDCELSLKELLLAIARDHLPVSAAGASSKKPKQSTETESYIEILLLQIREGYIEAKDLHWLLVDFIEQRKSRNKVRQNYSDKNSPEAEDEDAELYWDIEKCLVWYSHEIDGQCLLKRAHLKKFLPEQEVLAILGLTNRMALWRRRKRPQDKAAKFPDPVRLKNQGSNHGSFSSYRTTEVIKFIKTSEDFHHRRHHIDAVLNNINFPDKIAIRSKDKKRWERVKSNVKTAAMGELIDISPEQTNNFRMRR